MADGGKPHKHQGQIARKEAEADPVREEVGGEREVLECQESVADGMLKILDLLDERAKAIGTRLEQIEVRMEKLKRKDEEGRKALAETVPGRIRLKPGSAMVGHKCKMGCMILMLGILGVLVSAKGAEAGGKRPAYEGIQRLLESVAMGIEEKQSEIREMDQNISAKKMEVTEL
jgi:hypothetical protein